MIGKSSKIYSVYPQMRSLEEGSVLSFIEGKTKKFKISLFHYL